MTTPSILAVFIAALAVTLQSSAGGLALAVTLQSSAGGLALALPECCDERVTVEVEGHAGIVRGSPWLLTPNPDLAHRAVALSGHMDRFHDLTPEQVRHLDKEALLTMIEQSELEAREMPLDYHDVVRLVTERHRLNNSVVMWSPTPEYAEEVRRHVNCTSGCTSAIAQAYLRRRVVFDGVLTRDECRMLIEAQEKAGSPPQSHDGPAQEGRHHFTRADLRDLVEADVSPERLEVFLQGAERVKALITAHFQPTHPLHFDLVDMTGRRKEPAHTGLTGRHGLHADNAGVAEDGSYEKTDEHCCAWREYSALLYLNGEGDPDFPMAGGDFAFSEDSYGSGEARLAPKCGRMVAFTSGYENLHGVYPTLSGKRYAMATWLSDASHDEPHHFDDDIAWYLDILDGRQRDDEGDDTED